MQQAALGSDGQGQKAWFDKYVTDQVASKGTLTQLSFAAIKTVPPHDWAAAQVAEQREAASRPQAALQALRSKYERVDVPCARLRDGQSIPLVGLGTWKAEKGQVRQAVHQALQAGYRHIDCAAIYQNEEEVGDALEIAIAGGHVQREELFICSKVWNNDHAADRVRAACLKSLKDLKLSYLDLYMIHWPVTGSVGPALAPSIQETWRAMEGLVREGLVCSIGVSNFSARKLGDILSYAQIPPAVCQVEVHPYHRNDAMLAWCAQQGIHVTAYSPLGSPDSESIFPRKRPLVLMEDPALVQVAKKVGKNVGQVLIRWALQHGTSVIPKSTSAARIRGNLQVLDWELGEDDYRTLCTLPCQQRMVNGAMWLNPRGPYRTMEDLWDEPEEAEEPQEGERGQGRGGPPAPTPTPLCAPAQHSVPQRLPGQPAQQAAQQQAQAQAAGKGAQQAQAQAAGEGAQQVQVQAAVEGERRFVELNNGALMPLVGLGTWKSAPGQVRAAVEAAVKLGYRHIDCAEVYQNEHEVGQALEGLIESGVVRREELWVTSKVWNSNHAAPAVARALRRTLTNLRLTYLDLYLIHWPSEVQPPIQETWRAMEGLVREGLVRSIGVSNFSARKLGDILAYAQIPPAVCQVEVHPYHRNDALLAWCTQHGIHVTAYSPLGSPDSASLFRREAPTLLQDPSLSEVAQRMGRSPAQVLIRWALQHGTSVLPKSTSPHRIQENADVWGWELGEDDYRTLCTLGGGQQHRMVDGSFLLSPEGPYRTLQELWDE